MPTIINPTITDAGLAAAVDADANALQLAITHVSLGAAAYTPTGTETALADGREVVAIADGAIGVDGVLTVSVLFPSYGGAPYEAKEIGFWAGVPGSGGVLFAVHSVGAGGAGFVHRTTLDFIAQFSLGLTRVPAGSVDVTIDPAAAVLHAMLQAHRLDPSAHPAATTVTPGFVELATVDEVRDGDGGGVVTAAALASLGKLHDQIGYQILPGGLIMQWGSVVSTGSVGPVNATATFPIPFPNQCLSVTTTVKGGATGSWVAQVANTTQAGANFSCTRDGAYVALMTVSYLAIGF